MNTASRPSPSLVHLFFRLALAMYLTAVRGARWLRGCPRPIPVEGAEILLTGTFYSENWIRAHVGPLAASERCRVVRVVSTYPLPAIPKVEAIYPSARMVRILGGVPARLMTFCWVAIRDRPDVVGGFHLLINGLVAGLLAPLVRGRSAYFCVGGPWEVLEGGIRAENRLFARLVTPDPVVEGQLLQAAGLCDLIITMGSRAAKYLHEHAATSEIRVVSGGLDGPRLRQLHRQPEWDLILVARLVPIKAIDLFLSAVTLVQRTLPSVKALVVGDGPLRAELEAQAEQMGLGKAVTFAGFHRDVAPLLARAKVFSLTSQSEGLALSLMEAMSVGLPAVVPAVGDLPDLVEHGVNGFLVQGRSPEAFATAMCALLDDPDRLSRFSAAARQSGARHDGHHVTAQWTEILGGVAVPVA